MLIKNFGPALNGFNIDIDSTYQLNAVKKFYISKSANS